MIKQQLVVFWGIQILRKSISKAFIHKKWICIFGWLINSQISIPNDNLMFQSNNEICNLFCHYIKCNNLTYNKDELLKLPQVFLSLYYKILPSIDLHWYSCSNGEEWLWQGIYKLWWTTTVEYKQSCIYILLSWLYVVISSGIVSFHFFLQLHVYSVY